MSTTLPDPAARLLNLPPALIGPSPTEPPRRQSARDQRGDITRRRLGGRFSVYTAHGRGSYRSYAKAHAAARWVAQTTGETVSIVNDGTAQSWKVSAGKVFHPFLKVAAPVVARSTRGRLMLTA
jgi:hypothetical protein